MRKLHRALALFFSPFLVVTAVTGLLWAYAPHLYLKPEGSKKTPLEISRAPKLSPVDALRAAGDGGGKPMSVTLRGEGSRLVYAVAYGSKDVPKEALVDAETGEVLKKPSPRYPGFHHWIMKIHRLEFFGTKKELTLLPGAGLLALLLTGAYLFRYGLRK